MTYPLTCQVNVDNALGAIPIDKNASIETLAYQARSGMINTFHAIEFAKFYAEVFHTSTRQIFSRYRGDRRAIAARDRVYVALRMLGASYPHIGILMGRDHASVMNGVKKVLGK